LLPLPLLPPRRQPVSTSGTVATDGIANKLAARDFEHPKN
jgi:hypothetical protein